MPERGACLSLASFASVFGLGLRRGTKTTGAQNCRAVLRGIFVDAREKAYTPFNIKLRFCASLGGGAHQVGYYLVGILWPIPGRHCPAALRTRHKIAPKSPPLISSTGHSRGRTLSRSKGKGAVLPSAIDKRNTPFEVEQTTVITTAPFAVSTIDCLEKPSSRYINISPVHQSASTDEETRFVPPGSRLGANNETRQSPPLPLVLTASAAPSPCS